jgi:cell division septal protein FtsQ
VTIARRTATAVVLIGLAALGWLFYSWLRDSSLVGVRHVKITGISARSAPAVRRVLRETAMRMTTLHVDTGELRRAVEAFPEVRSVSADADFPSTLKIRVHQYHPVALLTTATGQHVAVASDGTFLPRLTAGAKLPAVGVASLAGAKRLGDSKQLTLVHVTAGAPAALRPQLARADATGRGIRVTMRRGPTILFGSAERVAAKWAAATRVLADPSSEGATLLDVRLPERPAASGFGGATPVEGLAGVSPGADAGATGAQGAVAAPISPDATGATGANGLAPAQP